MEMHESWLVQRLSPPHNYKVAEAFSFGGGLVRGGLSKDAFSLLREIFSFDYMGAAEFEFGAVPEALRGLARDAEQLQGTSLRVALSDVPAHWRDSNTETPTGHAVIYVLCRRSQLKPVVERIKLWATGKGPRLKEATYLTSILRPDTGGGYTLGTCGWLELDNGFFFFTDQEMWLNTCTLFGVEADTVAPA